MLRCTLCNAAIIPSAQSAACKCILHHLTVTTFFRIWAPSLFKDLDEILFMDCDIVVDGDLSCLFDPDVQGYPLAAARVLKITYG